MYLPQPTARFYGWACMLLALWMLFCLVMAKVLVCGLPFGDSASRWWWSAAMWMQNVRLMVGLYLMVGSTFAIAIELYRHWAHTERKRAGEEQTPLWRDDAAV